jgi:hypothetical protein
VIGWNAPSAATVTGGTQDLHEYCPAWSSMSSGFWSNWTLFTSAFQVPTIPAPAAAVAEAFSLAGLPASLPPTLVCLQADSASSDAAAIATVIVLCIERLPVLATARHHWRVVGRRRLTH